MSDIIKVIGILQAVRDTLRAKEPGIWSGAFSEELHQLQEAIALLSPPADEPAGEPEQPRPTCKVCGNEADEVGVIEHGRGCYVVSEDGGGYSLVGDE